MRTLVFTMALTLALGSVALAGPKDKTQEALINNTDVAGKGLSRPLLIL